MANNREEIELLYEQKIKNLQSSASRNTSAAANALEELRSVRSRIDTLNHKIGDLETQNQALLARNRDLEKLLEVTQLILPPRTFANFLLLWF